MVTSLLESRWRGDVLPTALILLTLFSMAAVISLAAATGFDRTLLSALTRQFDTYFILLNLAQYSFISFYSQSVRSPDTWAFQLIAHLAHFVAVLYYVFWDASFFEIWKHQQARMQSWLARRRRGAGRGCVLQHAMHDH